MSVSVRTRVAARVDGRRAFARVKAAGKMRLRGVTLDVWENLGWHWCFRHKHFGLYPDGRGKFYLLMSPDGRGSGRPQWNANRVSSDPARLIRASLALAKAEIAQLQGCVDEVEALLVSRRRL